MLARIVLLGSLGLGTIGCRSILGVEETVIDPAACELVPQRIFFADKPVSDTTLTVGVVTQGRLQELASDLGVTLDPSKGHGLAEVVDCEDEPAGFAAVDIEPSDSGVTSFVVSGDQLVLGTDTGVEGALGALNLPTPAELKVTAYPDEIEVESSEGDVVTRAGEVARIVLSPNSEVMVTPPMVDEWMCVGTIDEPVVSDPTITLTVEVQESSALLPSGVPIEGLRVAICLDEAAACQPGAPVADGESAVTDASGRAQLIVATGDSGFDGQLVVTGTMPGCEGS